VILDGVESSRQASFSFGNRIGRLLWNAVWLLLFRPSPRPLHAWRAALLRAFGARIGRGVHVYPGVRIWAPWQLEIGDEVGIGDGVILYSMARITIGDRCVISQGAHLCCGSHDIDSANFQLIALPIALAPFVWVCADAFIGPGVTIAEGVVVGARAVLCKSAPQPWVVWKGNPALPGRRRVPARAG
jgi:putative colanic acid biosynthesis acetyltransferase WcaF